MLSLSCSVPPTALTTVDSDLSKILYQGQDEQLCRALDGRQKAELVFVLTYQMPWDLTATYPQGLVSEVDIYGHLLVTCIRR